MRVVEVGAPPATVVGRPTRDGGQAEAARRVLAAAAPLFYRHGVRAVSADAVIEAAGVTKATFYRHFRTKDDLVVAYLQGVSQAEQRTVDAWRAAHPDDPAEVLRAYARSLGEQACGPGFHGCPFLNALAEHPDPGHPVREAAQAHRRWQRATATSLLADLGVDDPDLVALQLLLLRDGATAAGDGTPPARLTAALLGAGAALVRATGGSSRP